MFPHVFVSGWAIGVRSQAGWLICSGEDKAMVLLTVRMHKRSPAAERTALSGSSKAASAIRLPTTRTHDVHMRQCQSRCQGSSTTTTRAACSSRRRPLRAE